MAKITIKVEKPKTRITTPAHSRGKVIPNKKKLASKKACRGKVEK